MNEERDKISPERSGTTMPVIANVILLVCTAGILWWALTTHREQQRVTAVEESRFITMEWNLLQELKAQTDQQLMDKDREITALRRRYAALQRAGASAAERQQLERELEQAAAERERIMARRFDLVPAAPEPVTDAAGETDTPTAQPAIITPSPLTEVLEDRTTTLREEIEARDATIGVLEDDLTELRATYTDTISRYERELAELQHGVAATTDRTAPPTISYDEIRLLTEETIRASISRDGPDPEQTTLELLNTRTLLRAIVNTPEVREEHPELGQELDRYLATIQARSERQGRNDAFLAAERALLAVARELETPDTGIAEAAETEEPAAVFAERLVRIIEGIHVNTDRSVE